MVDYNSKGEEITCKNCEERKTLRGRHEGIKRAAMEMAGEKWESVYNQMCLDDRTERIHRHNIERDKSKEDRTQRRMDKNREALKKDNGY